MHLTPYLPMDSSPDVKPRPQSEVLGRKLLPIEWIDLQVAKDAQSFESKDSFSNDEGLAPTWTNQVGHSNRCLKKVQSAPSLPIFSNLIFNRHALSAHLEGSRSGRRQDISGCANAIWSAAAKVEYGNTLRYLEACNSPVDSFTRLSVSGEMEPVSFQTAGCDPVVDNTILHSFRARHFYGREWVFEKILRYICLSKQSTSTNHRENLEELDTITEVGTVLSESLRYVQHPSEKIPSHPVRKMVIVGGPGSGKSTICRRLMDAREQYQKLSAKGFPSHKMPLHVQVSSRVLAIHICYSQILTTLDPVNFVLSLHQQIANATCNSLSAQYKQALEVNNHECEKLLRSDRVTQSVDRAFRYGILASLSKISYNSLFDENAAQAVHDRLNAPTGIGRFLLVIDGLDEMKDTVILDNHDLSLEHHAVPSSSDKHSTLSSKDSFILSRCGNPILELLVKNIQYFPDWLCLLLTCRRQNKNVIHRLFPGIRRITIDDLHRSAVCHDVHQYVLSRLSAEKSLQRALYAHMHTDILGLLRIKSSACYLYLETILDGLSESWIKPDQLLTIPGTLNGLFLWLCKMLFTRDNSTDLFTFEAIRPILDVLLASEQTLSEADLYSILAVVQPGYTKTIFQNQLHLLDKLLVTISVEQERREFGATNRSFTSTEAVNGLSRQSKIHFFHPSFAEWLLDVKHCTPSYLCDKSNGLKLIHFAGTSPELSQHWYDYTHGETPEQSAGEEEEQAGSCHQYLASVGTKSICDTSLFTTDDEPRDQLDSSCYYYTTHTANCTQPENSQRTLKCKQTPLVTVEDSIVLAARKGEYDKLKNLLEFDVDVDQLDEDGWSALRTASWRGYIEIVDLLLRHGAQVNLSGPDGRSALRAAAWAGHEGIVRQLLCAGADVDIQDAEGRTPLIAAAYMGHVGVVELLANAGADLNHADEDGRTALHVAAFCVRPSETHHEVVSCLLDCGANPNVFDTEGISPLLGAARVGSQAVCELCLEADTDVNQTDKCGNTALMLAVLGGHLDVVRLLLFWGAAVDVMDAAGRSLLSLAAAIGHGPIVQLLLARGLDEAHRDHAGCIPLHLAAAGPSSAAVAAVVNSDRTLTVNQYCEVVRILLDSGAHLEETDNSGRTPFLVACEANQVELVKLMLSYSPTGSSPSRSETAGSLVSSEQISPQSRGPYIAPAPSLTAPINLPSLDNQTPLRAAALANNADLVSLLLSAGADPDYQDAYGRTTLYLLALEGELDMVDLLLHTPSPGAHARPGSVAAVGANPVLADDEGRCPLHVATWQGHVSMVKLLLQAGTPVDIRDREGRTPLQLSAWQGHAAICHLLLHEGNARVDAVCSQGATSLCIAAQEGHYDVCSVLLQAGANPFQADSHGRTPYRVALKAGHLDICKLLERSYGTSSAQWVDPSMMADPNTGIAFTPQGYQHDVRQQHAVPLPVHFVQHSAPRESSVPQVAGHPSSSGVVICQAYQTEDSSILPDFRQIGKNLTNGNVYMDDPNPYAKPPGPLLMRSVQPNPQDESSTSAHLEFSKHNLKSETPNLMTDRPFVEEQHSLRPHQLLFSWANTVEQMDPRIHIGHVSVCRVSDFQNLPLIPRDRDTEIDSNTAYYHAIGDQRQAIRMGSLLVGQPHSKLNMLANCDARYAGTRQATNTGWLKSEGVRETYTGHNLHAFNLGQRGMLSDSHSPVPNLSHNTFVPEMAVNQQQQSCWNVVSTRQEHLPCLYPDLLSHQFSVGGNPARSNAVQSKHAPQTNTTNVSDSQPPLTHGAVSPAGHKNKGNAPAEKLKTEVDESTDSPAKCKTGSPTQASPLPVGSHPSPSTEVHKAPSTKSTIAGMFGLGGRRGAGRKSCKKPTLSEIPSAALDSKKPSPKSQNVHPTLDNTTNFEGKQLKYSANRAQLSSSVPDPTKSPPVHPHLINPTQQQNVSNVSASKAVDPNMAAHNMEKYPSGSVQLESLARKFACCSQIEGVPSEAKVTYWMKKGQTSSKLQQQSQRQTSPQLWVSQSQARKKSSRHL
ncbi:ankyrin repeat domain-containing protein 50 [Paragonimus westermani]|uniref:Ankyrin repeat domain-containing protein 50 n=1 Tax=Paragonimus westermani TaxID=34504 RepID=A0A5J4NVC6_9TREM|nr:ankyrin repeat domain-containing protein 50 [Paragonimus westermani]